MICLTFDTDYMTDLDMREFLSRFPIPGRATFFLWCPLQDVEWKEHEVEPHPAFSDGARWEDELDRHVRDLEIRPRGIRTHSCAYSQMLGIWLGRRGYRYVSNSTPLFQDSLAAYRHPWGIWELPIYYMDNMDFCMMLNWPDIGHKPFDRDIIERAVDGNALYVFDFHPVHIAMNTPSFEKYQTVRPEIASGQRSPFDVDFAGRGTRTFFLELCEAMEANGLNSHCCLEVLEQDARAV